jgi:hypothetical protein
MDGSFEIVNCGAGRGGRCVRQMAAEQPVVWRNGKRDPSALLGDLGWKDYTLKVDVMLERAGYVELQGRVGTQGHDPAKLDAYFLRVTDKGAWSIIRSTQSAPVTLASGTAPALGTNAWHTLALTFKGTRITAAIDGRTVGSAIDTSYTAGQVGIATSQTINVQFDNLSVTGGTAPPPIDGTYKLVNENSGLVLSVAGASTADGALIEQAADSDATSRQWVVTAIGGGFFKLVNRNSGLALHAPGVTAGSTLDQHADDGSTAEQWQVVPSGDTYTLTSRSSGLVADVKGHATTAGAPVIQWTVNNGTNQHWQLIKVA